MLARLKAKPPKMRAGLIRALAIAVAQDPKLDRHAMIEALRDNDPNELQANAGVVSKAQDGSVTGHMHDILMRSYRSKLRKAA